MHNNEAQTWNSMHHELHVLPWARSPAFFAWHACLQACWAAGVDLGKQVEEVAERREDLHRRRVPAWKTQTVRFPAAGVAKWCSGAQSCVSRRPRWCVALLLCWKGMVLIGSVGQEDPDGACQIWIVSHLCQGWIVGHLIVGVGLSAT